MILSILILGTNFSEILNDIRTFSFKKMHLKISAAKWRQFFLSLNVSNTQNRSPLAPPQERDMPCITSQTVMLGGIPLSINHGMVRKVASHGMRVNSLKLKFLHGSITYNDQHCYFTSIGKIWNRGMLQKVRYQNRIFLQWCWVQIERCWVEIVSTQHQAVILRIENSPIGPHWRLWFRHTFIYGFCAISTCTQAYNLIKRLSKQGQIPRSCWMLGGWNSTQHHCLRGVVCSVTCERSICSTGLISLTI